jgi:hypothetical protein
MQTSPMMSNNEFNLTALSSVFPIKGSSPPAFGLQYT